MNRIWMCLGLTLATGCTTTPGKPRDSGGTGGSETAPTTAPGELVADRTTIDFGTQPVGTVADEVMSIENTGGSDLTVQAVSLAGSGPFGVTAAGDFAGLVLPPDTSVELVVSYTADDEVADTGLLTIETDQGVTEVSLAGTGAYPPSDAPEARIVCPPVYALPGVAELDGSGSTAADGLSIVDYAWTLEATPDGANGQISDDMGGLANLYLALPGTWGVSLQVEDEGGATSEPAVCEFDVVPTAEVFVGVYWDTNDSDLDLHLTEGDAPPFELPGDCTYCNPNPDWGASGAEGDPVMLLDDRLGYGPEVIAIDSGAEDDYAVWVHYFDDKGGGDSTATVLVWTDGALLWEGTARLEGRDMWQVGTFSPASGVFTESGEAPDRWDGEVGCTEAE